jgi:RecJ-like exonuclease
VISLFLDEVERIAKIFKELIKNKHVKIYAQFDSDGITSASMMAKALLRENCNFELRVIKQLNSKILKNITFNDNDFLIFLDMGSGQINILKEIIERINVLIVDHHEPINYNHPNLLHLNPLLFGEEPEKYSTSILTFIFLKFVNPKNIDLIDLAIVGAVGDRREEGIKVGAMGEILEDAKSLGFINVVRDLKFIGSDKPLFKVLAYSLDPLIPNIYGNEAAAMQFLKDLNIDVKRGDEWRTLKDLSEEEKARIADGIIKEKLGYVSFSEIFGEIFLLLKKPEFLSDSREFSILINACSRLGESDLALRLCLGDYSVYNRSLEKLEEYRRQLAKAISFIENNNKIIEKENGIFIIGESNISDSLIGTVISIFLNSRNSRKPVFGLAYDETSNMIKVSARNKNGYINLREVLVSVVKELGGEAGGHRDAAGAFIPVGKDKEFIEKVNIIIGELSAKEQKS